MKLAQLFSDFEEELIRQGEEAESLSFVYRSLKNLFFTDFVFALQQEVTDEEMQFVEEIYQQLAPTTALRTSCTLRSAMIFTFSGKPTGPSEPNPA